jgi:hypothetical protein
MRDKMEGVCGRDRESMTIMKWREVWWVQNLAVV